MEINTARLNKSRLDLLDYGRFFAAILVLFFHYSCNGIVNGKISSVDYLPIISAFTKYGYLGVELFFLISGYVIFFSAENNTFSRFVISRLKRLYPLFWFAVIFTSIIALFFTNDPRMMVTPAQIITNFSMVAPYFGYAFVDGVYWTLVFELKFYFIVTMFLLFRLSQKLNAVFILWGMLIVLFAALDVQRFSYFTSYFSFFVAGSLIAISTKKRKVWMYILILALSLVSIDFSISRSVVVADKLQIILSDYVVAIAIISFYVFMTVFRFKFISNLTLPKARMLGALTFPVYLIHAHFGYMFLTYFATNENYYYLLSLLVAVVLFISYIAHVVIEVKLSKFWNTLFTNLVLTPKNLFGRCKLLFSKVY